MATTPDDVASWMLSELQRKGCLHQEVVVYDIETKFGKEFIYHNINGNPAIGKKVLAAFNKLTTDSVVWERGARLWRLREQYDGPGRQQH